MITRRDKLLTNPWEQRKYENHLRKINSAVPVIDNRPPISRQHVAVKLKKRQTELERMRQIENDNLILLRRINYVMNTNRVDNWNVPPQQTKYLNRVPLRCSSTLSRPYSNSSIASSMAKTTDSVRSQTVVDQNQNHLHLRKSKCLACSPHIYTQKPQDSERIPWEEPKMYSKTLMATRERSQSLPVIKTAKIRDALSAAETKGCASSNSSMARLRNQKHLPKHFKMQKQISLDRDRDNYRVDKGDAENKAQKLVISSGSLKLCVKFPSDSHIMINNGKTEKTVFGNQRLHKFK